MNFLLVDAVSKIDPQTKYVEIPSDPRCPFDYIIGTRDGRRIGCDVRLQYVGVRVKSIDLTLAAQDRRIEYARENKLRARIVVMEFDQAKLVLRVYRFDGGVQAVSKDQMTYCGDVSLQEKIVARSFDVRTAKGDQLTWLRNGLLKLKGGRGSGNYGHAGRPGEVGGSSGEGGFSHKNYHQAVHDGTKWTLADGSPLPAHLEKVRIPPAWRFVSVAKDPNAALLVRGVDSKDRVQSIYSATYAGQQAAAKFERTKELLSKLEQVRKDNQENFNSRDPKTRDAAIVTELIAATGVRPGSDKNTGGEKQAYGATTLLGKHVVKDGGSVRLQFTGKKGVDLDIEVPSGKVADIIQQRAKEVGSNGRLFSITDSELRDYVADQAGDGFHPKDLRTARGTSEALRTVKDIPIPKNAKEYKKAVREVAKRVSKVLGNTPTVALQSYIDPHVFAKWREAANA